MLLGQRLRALRKAQGVTMRDFARLVGKDYVFYGEVERGENTHCSVKYLIPIADALGTSLDYLAGRTDDPTFRPVRRHDQASA